jgi:hypothetical protein
MAVAVTTIIALGSPRYAAADIVVSIFDAGVLTNVFNDPGNDDGPFATGTFSTGSYKLDIDVTRTDYPGGVPSEISTQVQIGDVTSSHPEDLKVQVQILDDATLTMNKLWNVPLAKSVTVTSSSELTAAGDTSGQVTTVTYFNSTTSSATTGLKGTPVTGTLADGQTGHSQVVANPNLTFTLSQTVLLHGLVIPSGGSTAPSYGGTSVVIAHGVPEPSTMALAGLGALGLIGYGLRRRKAAGA